MRALGRLLAPKRALHVVAARVGLEAKFPERCVPFCELVAPLPRAHAVYLLD
ncbi:hypothetical protein [Sorangium sp. So ce124]|uniref:hypothetical protein n=1 Tax=Sorangium sp. So ce124 TaxID=3133280 RepID=UPI003F5FF5C4